ncbi:hypothetical protein E8E13_002498 [Curvularia kusanoi]|uniref:Uncharacterized protein n=1 Tax=Curvularia kusanoi TaxID=90978 RepID=A0A9P4WC21_CURKU|nr:hypothetical protein E8E13_002498 [Curvularia kusanoi]
MSELKVGCQTGPTERGTLTLIYSCLITIFACTWTVLHLNVPGLHDKPLTVALRKAKWMAITILLPEFVFSKAIYNLRLALDDLCEFDAELSTTWSSAEQWTDTTKFPKESFQTTWKWNVDYGPRPNLLYRLLGLPPPNARTKAFTAATRLAGGDPLETNSADIEYKDLWWLRSFSVIYYLYFTFTHPPMRLLYTTHDGQFRLTKDYIGRDITPAYAILSHTWQDGHEVTFDDLKIFDSKGRHTEEKAGYRKLRFCAEQSMRNGLHYFWVDTCCIDKTNSAELSEAINSMFRWYQNAKKCFVYLSDVTSNDSESTYAPSPGWEQAFRGSRWFTRGWTLQELLAPSSVEFFSVSGTYLGNRESLKHIIHSITAIPLEALSGRNLSSFSVDERFSWTIRRQTTREEDIAYCLLGIFSIFMSPIYGEGGENAKKRLNKKVQDANRPARWLLTPDPSNHHKALKQRTIGTGLWFLESASFSTWKRESASQLWLYGIPGSGKTILSSAVIEHLLEFSQADTRLATAYFYFDFSDTYKQSLDSMLRSLVAQLQPRLASKSPTLEALMSPYGKEPPPLHVLTGIFRQTMLELDQVHIVIDALDECKQRVELLELLGTMSGWQMEHVHVLVTSRRERDIEISLSSIVHKDNVVCLQNEAVDEDIQNYIRQRLSSDQNLAKWRKDVALQQKLETTLTSGARGMFRWAACQLDALGKCRNRAMLEDTLATLPSTLDQTYERILCNIDKQDSIYVLRMLKWLAYSARPLYVRELAEIAAIDDSRDIAFHVNEILEDPMESLSICSSLVTISFQETDGSLEVSSQRLHEFLTHTSAIDKTLARRGSLIVSLAHYSVHEYLISDRVRQGRASRYSLQEIPCQVSLTRSCLRYFIETHQSDQPRGERAKARPLDQYTAQYWDHHFQMIESPPDDLVEVSTSLLSMDNPAYFDWLELRDPDFTREWPDQINYRVADPLYCAAFLGLKTVVKTLLKSGHDARSTPEWRFKSVLHAAVMGDHPDIVQILLDSGVNIDEDSGYDGTPLYAAVEYGSDQIAEMLVMAGAAINVPTPHARSPNVLSAAAGGGRDRILTMLLQNGADKTTIRLKDPDTEMYLVSENVDLSGRWLWTAAYRGMAELARAIIDHGADPNCSDGIARTSLFFAAGNGHSDVVDLLLSKGANSNTFDDYGWTPLMLGAGWGHLEVVESLLKSGADLDLVDRAGCTSLNLAAGAGHFQVAELLLKYGADPSISNKLGEAPLLHAARWNSTELIKLLLDNDAYGTYEHVPGTLFVSHLFARHGQTEFLRFIVEHYGADLREPDMHGRSCIEFAAIGGHVDTFRYLMAQQPHLERSDKRAQSLISLAAMGGCLDMVKLALTTETASDEGAGRWTALHWACRTGQNDVIEFLIAEGWASQSVRLPFETTASKRLGTWSGHGIHLWNSWHPSESPLDILRNCSSLPVSASIADLPGSWTPQAIAIFHGHGEQLKSLNESSQAMLDVDTVISYELGTRYDGASCDACFQGIYGPRFHCHTCGNFDYCFMCKPLFYELHHDHRWERLEPPTRSESAEETVKYRMLPPLPPEIPRKIPQFLAEWDQSGIGS